jgi:hypothetical protein
MFSLRLANPTVSGANSGGLWGVDTCQYSLAVESRHLDTICKQGSEEQELNRSMENAGARMAGMDCQTLWTAHELL